MTVTYKTLHIQVKSERRNLFIEYAHCTVLLKRTSNINKAVPASSNTVTRLT